MLINFDKFTTHEIYRFGIPPNDNANSAPNSSSSKTFFFHSRNPTVNDENFTHKLTFTTQSNCLTQRHVYDVIFRHLLYKNRSKLLHVIATVHFSLLYCN